MDSNECPSILNYTYNNGDVIFDDKHHFEIFEGKKKVVGSVHIDIFPLNIFPTLLSLKIFCQNFQADFGSCEL